MPQKARASKRWWLCNGNRMVGGGEIIIVIRLIAIECKVVSTVSVMTAGVDQGLGDGGLGGGGDENERKREYLEFSVRLTTFRDCILYSVHSSCPHSLTLMFFPPLDSTVFVDVPSNVHAGGVSLLFRARTGSASALEQLKHDGVKVQAWTNAPVDDDRAEGEWGAYNFEEASVVNPVNSDDSIVPFSLPPPIEDNVLEEPYTLFLTLKLRPLPRYQTKTVFLLTYRLLYPNSKIKWLGYYRRDLHCVLKKTDPWLAPPVPPNQTSGSISRPFTSITMKEPWGCWAIGRRRSASC